MSEFPPGHFSSAWKQWPGLSSYEPKLFDMLLVHGNKGSAELSAMVSESRDKRLQSDDPDVKWAAMGTIPGMGPKVFSDRAGQNYGTKPEPDMFHGKPCKVGHTLRYANGAPDCVACKRERLRKRAANRRSA
jgi:hypothetical protein